MKLYDFLKVAQNDFDTYDTVYEYMAGNVAEDFYDELVKLAQTLEA